MRIDVANFDAERVGKVSPTQGMEPLHDVDSLKHSNWTVRLAGVETLVQSPGMLAQHAADIVQLLANSDPKVRGATIWAFIQSPETRVQYAVYIMQRLDNSDSKVHESAINALGKSPAKMAQHATALIA